MNKELFKYLACPQDKKKLDFIEYNNKFFKGILKCSEGHCYPVFYGVPVLIKNQVLFNFLNDIEKRYFTNALKDLKINFNNSIKKTRGLNLLKQTYTNWSKQWEKFKTENTIWENEKLFFEHIPIKNNLLNKYKFVLEVGCGNGRAIQHIKKENNIIFAVDISESAYYASKRYEKDKNIFIIRCDAAFLPFNDNFFDFVFSDHVLQHMYDLRACFGEIKRVLKNDNTFIFNLYSKENNFIMTKFIEPSKIVFQKIPINLLYVLANVPAFLLWFVIKLIYLPTYKYAKKVYKFLPLSQHFSFWLSTNYYLLKNMCFDFIHAPIVNYYNKDDINQLSKDTSFELLNKYLLRQTLWICIGKFKK